MKYIFVTGGVVSGLGKGICAASLGRLLKQCGLRVKNQKFDPYFNVDPGTMSPFQHGEVFVTEDGAETDLDLGHYERFVDESLDGNASVSSGKVFWTVLNRERQGGYLGGTVQIIPHITDEIKRRIYAMEDGNTDVVISEIGGTVGDIESQPYLEAIRQVAVEKGRENVLYIHVPLIVSIPGTGELKSKPTQHSVKELLSVGIQPDILVCRTEAPITEEVRRKIALFCNVEERCVIPNVTAHTLYEVPLLLEKEGLCDAVCRRLGLGERTPDMTEWTAMVEKIKGVHRRVEIALVGKYTGLRDAYLSVAEALFHAGTACDAEVEILPQIFQQFNPFFVVALTPVLLAIFGFLAKKGKEPSAPRKIGLGMLIAACGFGIMAFGSMGLPTPDALAQGADVSLVSPNLLISTYLVLTFAELLLSPMGISFVSKVAPPKYKGMMMGGWFVATAIGNYMVSIIGYLWGGIELWMVWSVLIVLCLLSALFIFSIMKKLEKVA